MSWRKSGEKVTLKPGMCCWMETINSSGVKDTAVTLYVCCNDPPAVGCSSLEDLNNDGSRSQTRLCQGLAVGCEELVRGRQAVWHVQEWQPGVGC